MRFFGSILAGVLFLGLTSAADAQVIVRNPVTGGGVYVGPTVGYGAYGYGYSPWGVAVTPGTTYYNSGYVAPGAVGYAPVAPVVPYAAPYYRTTTYTYGYPAYGYGYGYGYPYRRGLFGGWRRW